MRTAALFGLGAMLLATGDSPADRADRGGWPCYACCSSYSIFFQCCYDPTYEHHATPCYSFGPYTSGPCHDTCVWGGCHGPCGFAAVEEDDLRRVALGQTEAVSRLVRSDPATFAVNQGRRALQVSNRCAVGSGLVGHIPLSDAQLAALGIASEVAAGAWPSDGANGEDT